MTFVSGIIIFFIGSAVGFIVHKFFGTNAQDQKNLSEQVNKSEHALEQYKADVAEHLESSAKLLEQMNQTCQVAMEQMSQSTKLLQQATPDEKTAMPFFSQEAQEHLAKTVKSRQESKANVEPAITEAPLDYSGNPSGLFNDEKQSVTNSES